MKTLVALLALVAVVSTATAQTIDANIVAANKVFMQAFANGATTMSDLYTTDAQLFPPNGSPINGNTVIGPFWKGAFEAGVKKAVLETTQTEAAGDRIIETGRYTLSGGDGKPMDSGKYIVVWKKEGGTWKLYRDIWNTSMAAK